MYEAKDGATKFRRNRYDKDKKPGKKFRMFEIKERSS